MRRAAAIRSRTASMLTVRYLDVSTSARSRAAPLSAPGRPPAITALRSHGTAAAAWYISATSRRCCRLRSPVQITVTVLRSRGLVVALLGDRRSQTSWPGQQGRRKDVHPERGLALAGGTPDAFPLGPLADAGRLSPGNLGPRGQHRLESDREETAEFGFAEEVNLEP